MWCSFAFAGVVGPGPSAALDLFGLRSLTAAARRGNVRLLGLETPVRATQGYAHEPR